MIKTLSKIPLWAYLLCLGFLTFYTYDIIVFSDMGSYMNEALNIFQGKGFTNMDGTLMLKRPLFPLMILASYYLLGISPLSAFWVVRLFCIINPILIYLIGKKLFSKKIGFVSGLFVLTSYCLSFWSYRHLDAGWPMFVLLGLYLTYIGFQKESKIYLFLSGICLGLAFLIKELSIPFFAFPLVFFIAVKDYHKKKNMYGVLLFYCALVLTLSPWFLYVFNHTDSFFSLLGTTNRYIKMIFHDFTATNKITGILSTFKAAGTITCASINPLVVHYSSGLLRYIYSPNNSVFINHTLVAPFFILSWVYTLYRAVFRKDTRDIFLSIMLFFSLPMMIYIGLGNLRFSQNLFIILVSYLVTARFLYFLGGWLSHHTNWVKNATFRKLIITHSSIGIILCVILWQVTIEPLFIGRGMPFLIRNYFLHTLARHDKKFAIKGDYGQADKEAGEWFLEHVPEGKKIMLSKPSEGKPIYFYSLGKYPFNVMPVHIGKAKRSLNNPIGRFQNRESQNNNIVFISSWADKIDPRNKIYVLKESDFFSAIKKRSIEYIVVSRRRNYLTKYLESNRFFRRVASFEGGAVKIYKVSSGLNTSHLSKTLVAERVVHYLRALNKEDRNLFAWFYKHFWHKRFGMSKKDVYEIMKLSPDSSERFELVRNHKIY